MWIIIVVAVVVALFFLLPIIRTASGRKELTNLEIADVDFKKLRDGTYDGKFKGTKDNFRDVSVEVRIASGVVKKIKVKKDTMEKKRPKISPKYANAVKPLLNEVINAQSLNVDTVSGATLTCKAHLKAVENALEKAKTEE
jgi:uncharacterized protein with FMN-binding domain